MADAEMNRSVCLFSTGLDSFIMSKLYPCDETVFIITGTNDNVIEYKRVLDYFFHQVTQFIDMSFMVKFELPNKIIPFRNYFMILGAAQFGHKIFLGATKGDTTRDKDETFAMRLGSAMSYFSFGPVEKVRHWGKREIVMPLRNYTKAESVKMYLDAGFSSDELISKSTSCYYPPPGGGECGKCRSCMRKFIALYLSGIMPAFPIPSREQIQSHLRESIEKGRESETKEIEEVLKRWKS